MPRPSKLAEKRRDLLPSVAAAFAELGYRRTTTAELARRCGVQENILYRLWHDKKAMFIASIGYVFDSSLDIWTRLLAKSEGQRTTAERILAYESKHHGEFGHYRILFAALGETDDAAIRDALADTFQRFQRWVRGHIEAHDRRIAVPDADVAAWAVVGLGTVANIGRELGLLNETARRRLFEDVGAALLGGAGGRKRGSA